MHGHSELNPINCSSMDTMLSCQELSGPFPNSWMHTAVGNWDSIDVACRAYEYRLVANAAGLVGEERFSVHAPPLPLPYGMPFSMPKPHISSS